MKAVFYTCILMLALSISACKKDEAKVVTYSCSNPCTLCEKSNETDVQICANDYDSPAAYGFALDVYESNGYDCAATSGSEKTTTSVDRLRELEEDGYDCEKDGEVTAYNCTITCHECKLSGQPNENFCREDFSSTTEYMLTLDSYEAAGYNCTVKSTASKTANSASQRDDYEDDGYTCTVK